MIAALKAGYRHIDTALAYGNESEVGEGIKVRGKHRSSVFWQTLIRVPSIGFWRAARGDLDHDQA